MSRHGLREFCGIHYSYSYDRNLAEIRNIVRELRSIERFPMLLVTCDSLRKLFSSAAAIAISIRTPRITASDV